MNTIHYDDFAKLDIRIGAIRSAGVVEGADKLLRLMVDFGEEELRQIISGIRTHYPDPQVLVGKKCPFIINLEPRIIRGLESRGMILAIGGDDYFSLLEPKSEIPIGASVG